VQRAPRRPGAGWAASTQLYLGQFRFAPRTWPSVRWQAVGAEIHACDLRPREIHMKQQAVEERRDWGADIMEAGFYSVLILVVTLLWVYIPA